MIDLTDARVVDFHAHMSLQMGVGELMRRDVTAQLNIFHGTPGKSYRWDDLEPAPDYERGMAQWAHPLNSQYRMLIRYVAGALGCEPDVVEIDERLSATMEQGFSMYLESVLDRERIDLVVLDLLGELRDGAAGFPDDRYVWIYGITPLLSPLAVIESGITSLDDAIRWVDESIDIAVAQGCVGFKNLMGYYRALDVSRPTADEAASGLRQVAATPPADVKESFLFGRLGIYDEAGRRAARAYEDFVIRHIVARAGDLGLLQLIHTGAQYSPNQNLHAADPAHLFSLFSDPASNGTTFVMLHAGAPYHENAAYMAWQFPNVYVDLSHTMRIPGRLNSILSTILSIAPAHKVLYGSDAYASAEWLGYSAHRMRKHLALVLSDLSADLEWTEAEAEQVGRMVLGDNARAILPGVAR